MFIIKFELLMSFILEHEGGQLNPPECRSSSKDLTRDPDFVRKSWPLQSLSIFWTAEIEVLSCVTNVNIN